MLPWDVLTRRDHQVLTACSCLCHWNASRTNATQNLADKTSLKVRTPNDCRIVQIIHQFQVLSWRCKSGPHFLNNWAWMGSIKATLPRTALKTLKTEKKSQYLKNLKELILLSYQLQNSKHTQCQIALKSFGTALFFAISESPSKTSRLTICKAGQTLWFHVLIQWRA